MTKNIAILYGGESCEHDISIITALSAYNIIKWDFNAMLVYMKNGKFFIGESLSKITTYSNFSANKLNEVFFQNGNILRKKRRTIQAQKIDCALVCNHGGAGENGALSGFLEVNNIPYTCSGMVESGICLDKVLTKKVLDYYSFPYLKYKVLYKNYDISELDNLDDFPYIIKPAKLGSSVGISVVRNKAELIEGIKLGHLFCNKILIEKALSNFEEFNCAAVMVNNKPVISSIEKPIFNDNYLNFYEKYITSNPQRELPAKISNKLRMQIEDMTKALYIQLNLSGIVRIDYLYCNDTLYINEINTVPGSLSTYLFKVNGLEPIELLSIVIEEAIIEFEKKRLFTMEFSSSVLDNFDAKQLKGGIKK
ncbi:MAG: hypothetical protein WCR54_02140 [Clostridia bacterium]